MVITSYLCFNNSTYALLPCNLPIKRKRKKSFDQVVLGAIKVVKISILTPIEKRAYKIEWEDWFEIVRIYGI